MKIAIIEPVGGHGGMDYYDYGLCLGLYENDIEPILYTSTDTTARFTDKIETVKVFNLWATTSKFIKLIRFIKGYCKAGKDARKKGITIVHIHLFDLNFLNLIALITLKSKGLKVVVTLHDVEPFNTKSNRTIRSMSLKRISTFIVHNKSSEKALREFDDKTTCFVVPHGNYLPFIKKDDNQKKSNENLKILFFGQIKEVKGLDILLEALKILNDQKCQVELSVCGKPWHDSIDKYKKQIEELGLSDVVSTDFRYIDDKELQALFAEHDLVVLPYKRIYQSGVVLLAMSYGIPVLTSDLPAFREFIVDGQNGFLFKTENPSHLANKIKIIKEHPEKLDSIISNAYSELNDKFSWTTIGATTKNIYTDLLK